jgi:hypothetical protein
VYQASVIIPLGINCFWYSVGCGVLAMKKMIDMQNFYFASKIGVIQLKANDYNRLSKHGLPVITVS